MREAIIYYDPITNKWEVHGKGYSKLQGIHEIPIMVQYPTRSVWKARRAAHKWVEAGEDARQKYIFERYP